MLKKYWKIVFLFLVLLLMLSGCKWFNPYEPDNTDPSPEVYFDYWIEYWQPSGSIVDSTIYNPQVIWYIMTYEDGTQTLKNSIDLEKKGENLFVGELNHVALHTKYDKRVFDFFVPDRQRQTYIIHAPVRVFGDVIYLVEKQSGTKYQLNNVMDYSFGDHYRYQYAEGSTMARCRILHDGSIPESSSQ